MEIKFQLTEDKISSLRADENFLNCYSRKELGCNADHGKIVELMRKASFTGQEEE